MKSVWNDIEVHVNVNPRLNSVFVPVLHYYIVFFVWGRLVIQCKLKKEYGV